MPPPSARGPAFAAGPAARPQPDRRRTGRNGFRGANAFGSRLGCWTMKSCCGYGCWTLAGGSQRSTISAIRFHVTRPFWLRRRGAARQRLFAPSPSRSASSHAVSALSQAAAALCGRFPAVFWADLLSGETRRRPKVNLRTPPAPRCRRRETDRRASSPPPRLAGKRATIPRIEDQDLYHSATSFAVARRDGSSQRWKANLQQPSSRRLVFLRWPDVPERTEQGEIVEDLQRPTRNQR